MWAVVPVKSLQNVKTRLAPALSLPERKELLKCMLQDVLWVLGCVEGLAGTLVVTCDLGVKDIASRFGAEIFEEAKNDGHSAAVNRAARWLARRGAEGLMQVPADIPSVTAEELVDVLAEHRRMPRRALTISPSHDYRGSNCVVCTPPDALELSFGDDSFRRHARIARGAGVVCTAVKRPGIALDIDEPGDLANFFALGSATRTQRFLSESGLGCRVVDFVEGTTQKGCVAC